MGILVSIVVGLIAGALAGYVMKGSGYGIIGDTIIGLLGGVVGGFVFRGMGIAASNTLGYIVISFAGAIILIVASRALKKA